MIKILLAAAVAAGIYALTRPKKKGRPDVTRPTKPGAPPPTKVREPPKPPEGWRETFRDGLVDAVATCGARELPDDYDQAVLYLKSCSMDLIFPQYSWPPQPRDAQWKRNAWFDPLLHSTVEAALRTLDVPGP